MAMPQAIQQQVEAAEQLQQQVYSEGQATEIVDQPAPEPEVSAPQPTAEIIELPKQAEQVAPVETPHSAPAEDVAYWKQRFDTLQGKFNAEVPQLYQQNRELQSQLQHLLDRLNKQEAAPEPKVESLVTQKDVDEFGEDLVNMVDRKATERARKELAAAMAEFEKRFGAVQAQMGHMQESVAQTAEEKFWGSVRQQVPDWDEVDTNPGWIEFLNSTPEFSEDSYRDLAAKAIQRGNAAKVVSLVKAWRGNPPQQVAPEVLTRKHEELARQVAPSTTKSSSSTPVAERIWTAADYSEAYDPRNVPRFGEKKAAEMLAEADRAVAEGRVRW